MEIQYKNPAELKPYENNTKVHPPEQVDRIAESIKRFGWQQPIVVDRDNVIIIGHGRLLAAKQLFLESVPVVYADNLTEEEAQALRLADNKTNESPWDFGKLEEELAALSIAGVDMTAFGFDDIEAQIDAPEVQEVETPEVPEEPKAKRGEIYRLGNHRLMCGDSTSKEDVAALMDGKYADLVFTDPPYLLETKGGCNGKIGKFLKKQGQDIEFISDFNPKQFLDVLPRVFYKNMNAYIFCNKELLPEYLDFARQNKYSWNVLVWKKPYAIPIGDSHKPDIEYIVLYRKNAIWNNGTKSNYSRCLEYARVEKNELNGYHPTIKPIELITNELIISSNIGSNVVDLFGGSGSTLIACEQTGRKCFMMELDPHYIDVIIKRWEDFTGQKAELIQGVG